MTWDHIAIFLGGVITGELGILFVLGMCRTASDAHDLPACQPAPKDCATHATGNTGASTRASADGLPLSEYLKQKKRFRCLKCGIVQAREINPDTCECGWGVFELLQGKLAGAIVDADRTAAAVITGSPPASPGHLLVVSRPDDKRAPRVR